jgi:hypothetical protein
MQAGGEDVIYFVARVAVVHDLTWKTQRLFIGHDDDIKSMAFHLKTGMVATGQVRPRHSDQRGSPKLSSATHMHRRIAVLPQTPFPHDSHRKACAAAAALPAISETTRSCRAAVEPG